jgi:arylformamidase
MRERRVQFDFEIEFTNGGGLQGQGFRLDIEGDDITDEELASYIIQDLRLLMVGKVVIHNKQIIMEPHKRTPPARVELSNQLVDLREDSVTLEELFSRVAGRTLRVIAPDGDSYLIRRAAQQL